MKVLIVDDNPDDVTIFSHILNMLMDHEVMRAYDGPKGLDLARETHFDLFLVDLNLPTMHGVEVTRILRSMEEYRTTPIILVTANIPAQRVLEGSEYTLLLEKPVFSGPLMEAIASVLS